MKRYDIGITKDGWCWEKEDGKWVKYEDVQKLVKALMFYADPETYFAIGFFPDKPCGEFIKDFEDTGMLGMKPGKKARKALNIKINKED